jgi:hypothetical protein
MNNLRVVFEQTLPLTFTQGHVWQLSNPNGMPNDQTIYVANLGTRIVDGRTGTKRK